MNPAAETDGAGNLTAAYFYGPGVDQPLSRTTGAGTVHYLQDGQGSGTALTDGSGTVLGRYHYTPWGEGWADTGLPSQPLRWTARELDETGLYYLRGRYYLPSSSIGTSVLALRWAMCAVGSNSDG